jgi:hypothetical protein
MKQPVKRRLAAILAADVAGSPPSRTHPAAGKETDGQAHPPIVAFTAASISSAAQLLIDQPDAASDGIELMQRALRRRAPHRSVARAGRSCARSTRFARDSSLERERFEPSVPR